MKLRGLTHFTKHVDIMKTRRTCYPQTRKEAREKGIVFYDPEPRVGCVRCKRQGVRIYTISEKRLCCARADAAESYAAAMRAGEPHSKEDAIDQRKDYYWTEAPAKYCGHVGKLNHDGSCFECGAGGKQ